MRSPRPAPFRLPRLETILLVALAVTGVALWTYRTREIPAQPRSVAVLPFENVTGDPAQDFFSEGISDEIRTALSRLPGLQVASRTSSFGMAGERGSARQIAQELGVSSLLEGSVQRAEGRVRVMVSLVDARTDTQLWTESYDRLLTVENLFAVQDEIAGSVAEALEVELGGSARLGRRAPASLEVHDLYLLGLYHWNRRTGPELLRAAEFFEDAVEEDPGYALAHAGVAKTQVLLPLYTQIPSAAALPRARAAADRAVALDSTLAEAHAARGFVYAVDEWNWEAVDREFGHALSLDPNYATGHQWYAVALDAQGRFEEAREQHERALALDPRSVIIHTTFGNHLIFTGDYEGAVRQLGEALALQPDLPLALNYMAEAQILAGRPEAAGDALVRLARAEGQGSQLWERVAAGLEDSARAGDGAEAVSMLAADDAFGGVVEARYYAFLGAGPRALDALERAWESRDWLLFLVDADPAFDRFDGEPRFDRILSFMGLR